MDAHPTFERFSGEVLGLSQEQFLASFPHPFVVVDPKGELSIPSDFRHGVGAPQQGKLTVFDVSDILSFPHVFVAPLVKTGRNAFQAGVTLGRTPNNDVVVPHHAVSKFHLYFHANPASGRMEVQDVGSRYGTQVGERVLPPGESAPLKSGATILVAKYVKITFFTAKDFYTYIHLVEHRKRKASAPPPPPGSTPPPQVLE